MLNWKQIIIDLCDEQNKQFQFNNILFIVDN